MSAACSAGDTVKPQDLTPGRLYKVTFDDFCVSGSFTGRFVELRDADYLGEPGFDAVVFDIGEIGPDWSSSWRIEEATSDAPHNDERGS